MLFKDFFSVERRYTRSVNLERDFAKGQALDGYLLGAAGTESLRRIANALEFDHKGKAWTLVGTYGAGKSAFALLLARLFAENGGTALSIVQEAAPELAGALGRVLNGGKKYIPVLVSSAREPLEDAILRGLEAVEWGTLSKAVRTRLTLYKRQERDGAGRPSRTFYDTLKPVLELLKSNGQGLFIVIDELGKVLEYAASHPRRGDVFLLQQIAELTANSELGLAVVTILHQGFENYARGLGETERKEWAKVQGRFEEISFAENRHQMLKLVGRAVKSEGNLPQTIVRARNFLYDAARQYLEAEAVVGKHELQELLAQPYPLHPCTCLIMPSLFRRFGQNQRSVFAFLSSTESYGFQEFLQKSIQEKGVASYRVCDLYDYLKLAVANSLSEATLRSWLQIENALERSGVQNLVDAEIIKTIGLSTLSGEATELRASKRFLSFAVAGKVDSPEVEESLIRLASKSVILYRKHKDAYALWDGSDVDLDEEMSKAREQVSVYESFTDYINKGGFLRPLIARRHSMQTGVTRSFEAKVLDPKSLAEPRNVKVSNGYVGSIIFTLCQTDSDIEQARTILSSESFDSFRACVALVPKDTRPLAESMHEYASLVWLATNGPNLESDPLVKRELRDRLAAAETVLRNVFADTYGLNNESVGCEYWNSRDKKDLRGRRGLVEYLSEICDELYSKVPRIRNEIINRNKLTSVAAKARKTLATAMLTKAGEEGLGISGYPPERSLYFSLLAQTMIHREEAGKWGFYPPPKTSKVNELRVRPVWKAVVEFLESAEHSRKYLRKLLDLLTAPPFGIPEGVAPLYVLAVFFSHDQEVAWYESGTFVPVLTPDVLERVLAKPSMFAIRWCRMDEAKAAVFKAINDELPQTAGKQAGELIQGTILKSLKPMFQMVSKLPEYTKRTAALSQEAISVRDSIRNAIEPDRLLFIELPAAFGLDVLKQSADDGQPAEFARRLKGALNELDLAYGHLLGRIEKAIFEAFSMTGIKTDERKKILSEKARLLARHSVDVRVKEFALRLAQAGTDISNKWVEPVASLVSAKPASNWSDGDEAAFTLKLAQSVRQFESIEALLGEALATGGKGASYKIGVSTLASPGKEKVVTVFPEEEAKVQVIEDTLQQLLKGSDSRLFLAALSKVSQQLLD